MTETMTAPAAASKRVRPWEVPGDSDRGWDLIRLGLVGAYVVVWALTLLTGSVQASFDRLNADLRSGEARSVQLVVDEFGDPDESTTDFRVRREVVWRDGPLRRQATLIWVDSGPERTRPNGVRVITTEPGAWLEQRYGVRVEGVVDSRGQSMGLWREGPTVHQSGPMQMAHVFLLLTTFAFLIMGPSPWRATRWAWVWMAFISPLGMLAFLLLSGPIPRIRPPADPDRRINGWWGFLIGLVLPGVTAGLAMSVYPNVAAIF